MTHQPTTNRPDELVGSVSRDKLPTHKPFPPQQTARHPPQPAKVHSIELPINLKPILLSATMPHPESPPQAPPDEISPPPPLGEDQRPAAPMFSTDTLPSIPWAPRLEMPPPPPGYDKYLRRLKREERRKRGPPSPELMALQQQLDDLKALFAMAEYPEKKSLWIRMKRVRRQRDELKARERGEKTDGDVLDGGIAGLVGRLRVTEEALKARAAERSGAAERFGATEGSGSDTAREGGSGSDTETGEADEGDTLQTTESDLGTAKATPARELERTDE